MRNGASGLDGDGGACGSCRLRHHETRFSHQEPYRRLFLILNEIIFILGIGYTCSVVGFIVGSSNEALRQGQASIDTMQFSPWLFAPCAGLLVAWAVCYGLLVLPSKIGLPGE